MTELVVRELRAAYGDQEVLHGVDLLVESGSLAAVLGPSGCGKTTLLRVLAGFHRAAGGQISLGGTVVAGPGSHVPPERRRVGVVPQEGALFPHLSVGSNVAFGLSRDERRPARVEEMLELVGLRGYAKRMPHELSGGQQQRVALARALAPAPRVVLLDEPFSALDAGLRAEVRADVRAALRATGATAVLVTHDQEEALGIADRVAVLREGQIAQVGTAQQLYFEPSDLEVALFVGEAVLIDLGTGNSPSWLNGLAASGSGGVAVIRPEQLRLSLPASDEEPHAVVRDVVFHGHDATVLVDPIGGGDGGVLSDDGVLRVRIQGRLHVGPGDAVRIGVEGEPRVFAREDVVPALNAGTRRV